MNRAHADSHHTPARVVFITEPDCSLCNQARSLLEQTASEMGISWNEWDAIGEPELYFSYGDRLPVILIDGVEHGFWKFDKTRLVQALTQLKA